MALLGDDGRGYELARKLESQGIWRSWFGDDSMYDLFLPFLSSPSSWESFMRTDDAKPRAQIQLQLRARALLFDKACVSLFPLSNRTSPSSNSKLNPNYLQLHGDDVYYTLENPTQNVAQPSKVQSKASFGVGSRYGVHEDDSMSQRIPESWYSQFFEKYRATKPYRLPSGDRESEKRTPEQMSNYLRIVEKHKRSRAVFMEDPNMGPSNPMFDNGLVRISSNIQDDGESLFFPETTFSANSVPDSALPPSNQMDNVQNVKCNGVLDTLPPVMTKSPIMLERLGIKPEYLNMEQTGNHDRGKSGSLGMKNNLSPEQAAEMSRKMVSRLLMDVGFDRASGGPLDIFGQLFGSHISKLGRILKVLSDGYKKEYSAIELLKMFLQTIGHGNLGAFAEVVKDSTKNNVQQQTQLQQVQAMQSQLQLQNQTNVRLPHQVSQFQRQMHNQIGHTLQQQQQHMVHPLQQQQHWDRMRRRQPSTSRPVMNMGGHMNVDNESQSQRSMVEVKLENPPEFPMDNNAASFPTMNYRNPPMQYRQQQFASISAFQAQSNNQFRPMASVQIPQLQPQAHSPNMGLVRAPPVKVEAFQELMGGDSSMKHDPDETKLTSPK
ncbi:hypothetical protein SSX86_003215 [Deinandra increscens subsp. villosa]|uniref:Bromodomain associated domain-containing protein n=1 Tax=Deinandra increscens subsp. villosa TaxID=3103831 RepID=A0AAP0H7J4_9ASTR